MIKCSCGFAFDPADYNTVDCLSMDFTTDGKEIHTEEMFYCPKCRKEIFTLNIYERKSTIVEEF